MSGKGVILIVILFEKIPSPLAAPLGFKKHATLHTISVQMEASQLPSDRRCSPPAAAARKRCEPVILSRLAYSV